MLKTHVIHRIVDGMPPAQEKIEQFQQLVDQFRGDGKHDVRKTEFFVNPVFGQTAVTLTAIITWADRAQFVPIAEQRAAMADPAAIVAGVR